MCVIIKLEYKRQEPGVILKKLIQRFDLIQAANP